MSKDLNFTAGFFGKLPNFRDFVKFNAGGDEVLLFDKWLQDGITAAKTKLKSDWTDCYRKSGELFFFNPYTGTGRALSGIIFFSEDKSGREFPFIVFFYLDKKLLNDIPVYLVPLTLSDTLNKIKSSVNDISSIQNLSDVNERLNNISYNTDNYNIKNNYDLYLNYLSSVSQTAFWDRITGDYNNMTRLSVLINLYLQNESSLPVTFSFQSSDNHYINDLTFLIHLEFKSRKISESFNAVFWTGPQNISHLIYIIKNKLSPDNFIDLIQYRGDRKLNFFLKQDDASVRTSFENLLEKDISLKEFLNAIQ